MLRSWFTGFLTKIGTKFGHIFDNMHTFATKAVLGAELSRAQSRTIVRNNMRKALLYAMAAQVILLHIAVSTFPATRIKQMCSRQGRTDSTERTKGTMKSSDPSWIPMAPNPGNTITNPLRLCLVAECSIDNKAVALANDDADRIETEFTFDTKPATFGTDNCATHHICYQRDLFASISEPATSIGVRGVSGSSTAEGIGTVKFRLKDDNKKTHDITLKNVIFLPQAAKNLISISQWSSDNSDDCNVTSRGKYSIFRWNHDEYSKTIIHPPNCPIPLMTVNEDNDPFILFATKHVKIFIDSTDSDPETYDALLASTTSLNKQFEDGVRSGEEQLTKVVSEGDIVRATINEQTIICKTLRTMKLPNGTERIQVRPLNSDRTFVLGLQDVEHIDPDPSDIPSSPSKVDRESLTHCLNEDEIKQL